MSDLPRARTSRIGLLLTVGLVIVGLGLVLFFGLRAYRDYRRLEERGLAPGVTDVEAIRGWMTLPYIAQAYGVPETALFEALGLPQAGNQKLSIRQLADKYEREPEAVRRAVQEAVRRHQPTSTPALERAP